MKIYSIKDMRAEGFNRPFFSQTRATAMREVQSGLMQDSAMANFASDFSLYELGEFSTSTGRLTAQDPYHVCDISELLTEMDNNGENESPGITP